MIGASSCAHHGSFTPFPPYLLLFPRFEEKVVKRKSFRVEITYIVALDGFDIGLRLALRFRLFHFAADLERKGTRPSKIRSSIFTNRCIHSPIGSRKEGGRGESAATSIHVTDRRGVVPSSALAETTSRAGDPDQPTQPSTPSLSLSLSLVFSSYFSLIAITRYEEETRRGGGGGRRGGGE